jgi:hypothetical protein
VASWLLIGFSQHANAASPTGPFGQRNVQLAYVQGEGDVQGIKLAVQQQSPFFSDALQSYGVQGTISFEMSANFWQYGPENYTDHNAVLALSPVLTYPLGTLAGAEVAAEFGIGLSLLDDTIFAGKNVSTHYQFEDRLGLVARLSAQDAVTLRYLHYSNAGFKKPNPGLDFIALGYSRAF